MKGIWQYIFLRGGLNMEIRAMRNNWKGKIHFGNNFKLGKNSILDKYMGGNITIGNNVTICKNSKLATCGGDIYIGDNSQLGEFTVMTAQGGIKIDSHVLFADHVSLIANEHNYFNVDVPIMDQGSHKEPIIIGEGTWIGINATILAGSTIGKNCVVAAGAVVKGKFPDYCVVGGVPAKILKRYDMESKEWR